MCFLGAPPLGSISKIPLMRLEVRNQERLGLGQHPSVPSRSESDAIGLEWPMKEAMCLDPRGPFCEEGFLSFICISLISSLFEKG